MICFDAAIFPRALLKGTPVCFVFFFNDMKKTGIWRPFVWLFLGVYPFIIRSFQSRAWPQYLSRLFVLAEGIQFPVFRFQISPMKYSTRMKTTTDAACFCMPGEEVAQAENKFFFKNQNKTFWQEMLSVRCVFTAMVPDDVGRFPIWKLTLIPG